MRFAVLIGLAAMTALPPTLEPGPEADPDPRTEVTTVPHTTMRPEPPTRPQGSFIYPYDGVGHETVAQVAAAGLCSASPLADKLDIVVTAAHCVLLPDGTPIPQLTIWFDEKPYRAREVGFDRRYLATKPSAEFDAAYVVLDRPLPTTGVVLSDAIPSSGALYTIGLQRSDAEGTVYRTMEGLESRDVRVRSEVLTACVFDATSVQVDDGHLEVPCSLLPGASGGPTVAVVDGEYRLIGVTSTYSSASDASVPTKNSLTRTSVLVGLLAGCEHLERVVMAGDGNRAAEPPTSTSQLDGFTIPDLSGMDLTGLYAPASTTG